MLKIFLAAFAATALLCLPAWATGEQQTSLGAPGTSRGIGIVNGSTTCGSTALLFASTGAGTMRLNVSGTLTSGAIAIRAAVDGSSSSGFTGDLTVYPRNAGAGATTITAAGDYTLPVMADLQMCVYGSSFTGAATVLVSFSPDVSSVVVRTDPANPLAVNATVNVAGAADLPGSAATFNGNNVCSSVLTAGEQSVGFHLDAGTLATTFTAFGTQTIGVVNCASAGTCTAISTSAGATIVVTNPNGIKDVSISALPGMRQIQVCTAASGTTGSATGVVTATYLNASSSGGGGGTVIQGAPNSVANSWPFEQTDGTNILGTAAHPTRTDPTGTTTQPVSLATAPALVASAAIIGKVGIDQTTPGTTNAVVASGTVTANLGTLNGAATAAKQPALGTVAVPSTDVISSITPDNPGSATTLSTACATGTSCAGTAAVAFSLQGMQSATMVVTTSTSPVGITTVVDCSKNGGTTPILSATPATSGLVGMYLNGVVTYVINNPVVGASYTLVPSGDCIGASTFIIRNATLGTGSIAVTPRTSTQPLGSVNFIAGKPLNLGQQTQANSLPVAFAQDQGPLPLSILAAAGTSQPVPVAVTTATETTLIAAIGSGLFTDLTKLDCWNTTSTATQVDFRDTTGGAISYTGYIAATGGAGFTVSFSPSAPWRSKTSNGNWTMKLGTAVGGTGVICNAQAQQRVP